MNSTSRKLSIASLVIGPISFILFIVVAVFAIMLLAAGSANEASADVAFNFGSLIGILVVGTAVLLGITEFILTIIAAVKTSHTTAKILSLVGLFVGFIFPILWILTFVGLIMIAVHNDDKY
ncbi:hypothetical protein DP065_01375 [[Mycoplasma] anseris]|uniref:DUF4064 domain-containing protein n=3 Tax=[Mycoplasma] anseris TaxID=92400 RepID=A0A2Z4NCV6_9BACT|nr:hypothetical protein DP065_01375 [[Mycoplasma] anseris]